MASNRTGRSVTRVEIGGRGEPPASPSRRIFLKRSLLGTVALSLAPLLPSRAAAGARLHDESGFFNADEATIVGGIARAFIPSAEAGLPDPVRLGVIERIGRLLARAHREEQDQLRLLLLLFERLPPLFAGTLQRFTEMSPEDQAAYLAGWGKSRLLFRRIAFQALKDLVMLTYYSRDEVWGAIGYDGPWV